MSESITYEWDRLGDGSFDTNITAYVLSCDIGRGRKTDLEPIGPGTATLVLNNHDGRFSPDYAAGAYYHVPAYLETYRRVRIKGTVVGGSTYGLFFGYVLDWDTKPRIADQTVTWYLGDRFALWERTLLNLPLLRKLPIKSALHLATSRALGANQCLNPSVEVDLSGYTQTQNAVLTRDNTQKLEGDYSIRADCDGSLSSQGWWRNATSETTASKPFYGCVVAVASETVSLMFLAYDNIGNVAWTITSVGTTPTLIELTNATGFHAGSTARYFYLRINGTTEVIFWSDGLYFVTAENVASFMTRDFDASTAEIELAASYRRPALEVVQAVAQSEPRSFFFPYCGSTDYDERLRFRDKDWRTTATVQATFSDDGADVPYHDLVYEERADDRISEAEVTSAGEYEDANESATIWELSPTGQTIPAGTTKVFHAFYSQPARDCSLSVNPSGSGDVYYQGTEDGYIRKYEEAHPPDAYVDVHADHDWLEIGQLHFHPTYYVYRSYVRFNTSGIAAGETVVSAKLRKKLKVDGSLTNFGIQVRDKAWGAALAAGDWDGTGTLRATYETENLPPAGEWVEIDLPIAAVQKEAWTEFELMSDNEAVAPTGQEYVLFWSADSADPPQLVVVLQGSVPESTSFENYGVGARIEIEATATKDLVIDVMTITGYPLKGSSEESKVVHASAAPPAFERTLTYALPLQGTRTASMETEAERLADRYDGRIRRCSLVLRPKTDAVLTQMLAREIGEKIHVENIKDAFSTWLHSDMWIEGIEHHIAPGQEHETIFYLEEV